MAKKERKYKASITLGALELSCEAHEQLHGDIEALEIVGGFTIGRYDNGDFPATNTLAFLPAIGGAQPPTPAGSTFLFLGKALIMGSPMDIAVFRTS